MILYRSPMRHQEVVDPRNLSTGVSADRLEEMVENDPDPGVEAVEAEQDVAQDRCDGCGQEIGPRVAHDRGDGPVRYCPGCELLRRSRDVEPGDHDQYDLRGGN